MDAQVDPNIGCIVGGTFCLTDRLGSGGFGTVYRARHVRVPMAAAVKLLSAQRALDADMVGRFQQEVSAMALLQHSNIVRVLDHGYQVDVGYFIAMEYLAGTDLAGALDAGRRFTILEITAIAEQAMAALEFAHQNGVIHRDIKAENFFLLQDGERPEGFTLKLLDFGLARLTRDVDTDDGQTVRRGNYRSTASRVFGSMATLAPEALTGAPVDGRADVYSLGIVLYELMAGEMPYAAMTVEDLIKVVATTQPKPPTSLPGGTWIAAEMEQFLLSAIARRVGDRTQSIADMRRGFEYALPAAEKAWARFFVAPEVVASSPVIVDPPLPDLQRRHAIVGLPMVLVVDDDKVLRGLLMGLVRASGCACETFADGLAVIAWLRDHPPPDALVADVLMPGMDGISLSTAMRAAGYDGAIVLCTSVATDRLRAGAAQRQRAWTLDKATELHRVPEILQRAGVVGGRLADS